jgi:hypothetical protein
VIREKTEQCVVGELVTRSRLRWLGHVARMGEARLPPQLLFGKVDGKSKKGRPVARWKDMIDKDLKKRKVQSWSSVVQDRAAWRRVVHGETKVVIRRDRKEQQKAVASEKVIGRLGVFCPKCGKEYHSNRAGWFKKHVDACPGTNELKVDSGVVVENVGITKVIDSHVVSGFKCQKCGKHYKTKAGGWFKKHVDACGPSQPVED